MQANATPLSVSLRQACFSSLIPDADNDANFPSSVLFTFLTLHGDSDDDIGDAVGDIGDALGDEDIPIDARQTTGDRRESTNMKIQTPAPARHHCIFKVLSLLEKFVAGENLQCW